MRRMTLVVAMALALAACTNPGIVQLSPDTYLLAKDNRTGMFDSMETLKARVLTEANDFAAQQGKLAIPVASQERPVGPGQFASFEYQFRMVDKDDPEARSTLLAPRPGLVVEKTERTTAAVYATRSEPSRDLYTELMKLDDLRKKGVITEEEFQAEKAKLLNGRKDLIKDR